VFGLKLPYGLGVFKPFTQCINQDRIQSVDAFTVFFQDFGCAIYGI
jgi:hypothetical protein